MSGTVQYPERYRAPNGDTVNVLSIEAVAEAAGLGYDDDVTIDDVIYARFPRRERWRIANIPKRVRWVTESFEDRQLLGRGSPCWKCGAPRDLATYVPNVDAEQAYGAPWTTWRVLTSCSRCFALRAGRTMIDGRCLIHGTDDVYIPKGRKAAACQKCVTQRTREHRARQARNLERSRSYAVGNDAGSASGSASPFSEVGS